MPFTARPIFGRQTTDIAGRTDQAESPVAMESVVVTDKGTPTAPSAEDSGPSETPDADAQPGVRKAQATTLTWSRTALYTTLTCIWFYTLTSGFRIAINGAMTAYATSAFGLHSLLTVVDVVAAAMTAACYIPLAKALDLWGRAEGFVVMVAMLVLGLVLQSAANGLGTLCAGRVFSSVGAAGAVYAYVIVATDATSLRNRGLAFAFTSSPYMVTAFAGPRAAEAFEVEVGSWRWAFGAFAIVTPFMAVPLYTVLRVNLNKAKKAGLVIEGVGKTEETWMTAVRRVAVEFDLIGVLLFALGLMLFLLPFNLAASAPHGWTTPWILAMLVLGVLFMCLFGVHEARWARTPWLPWHFLTHRSMLGTCLLNAFYQISYYTWNLYFQSFLQVVFALSIAEAGYINNTFSVVSGFLLFIVGFAIRRTGKYRWLFFIAVPLYTFALGLMIHFRQPNGNIGYVIMCEIFISIGGAVFVLVCQLSVLSAVDHAHASSAMSMLYVSGALGGAIGPAISGAIWTNVFPSALARFLPEGAQGEVANIVASLTQQLAYEVGSEERLAIQLAYGYAHSRMLAAGVAFSACMLGFMWLIEDVDVKRVRQTKGIVF